MTNDRGKRLMRSKTYRAKTMKEALTRVRRDLGGEAVILAAREVHRRRLFGLGAHALVEVTATDRMPSEGDVAVTVTGASTMPLIAPTHGLIAPAGPSPAVHSRFGEQLSR